MSTSLIYTFTTNSHNQNTHQSNRMDCSADGQHIIVYCGITNHTFENKALHYLQHRLCNLCFLHQLQNGGSVGACRLAGSKHRNTTPKHRSQEQLSVSMSNAAFSSSSTLKG